MVAVAGRQQREVDPVELVRGRADALAQRAGNLKKLADAWAPLYQSLNPDQKQRMRLLAMRVMRELRVRRGYAPHGDVRRNGQLLEPGNSLQPKVREATLKPAKKAKAKRR